MSTNSPLRIRLIRALDGTAGILRTLGNTSMRNDVVSACGMEIKFVCVSRIWDPVVNDGLVCSLLKNGNMPS